jgi:hypothetical protein
MKNRKYFFITHPGSGSTSATIAEQSMPKTTSAATTMALHVDHSDGNETNCAEKCCRRFAWLTVDVAYY